MLLDVLERFAPIGMREVGCLELADLIEERTDPTPGGGQT